VTLVAKPVPEHFLNVVSEHYGLHVTPVEQLSGGEESDVYRVFNSNGVFVLRIGPAWRSVAELVWSYSRAYEASQQIPEVTSPLLSRNGMPVVEAENRPLSLFPFVEGMPLDRDDDSQRDQAAVLLARLHKHFIGSTGHDQRPPTSTNAPGVRKPRHDPPEIFDPNLERYLSETRLERHHLRATIHGDFYRGNVLCRDKRIQGLIDWDDCRIGDLYQDLAWSIWEFAKDAATGDRLDECRAMRFVNVYRQSAGPVSIDGLGFVVPLIRKHLRYEIRRDVAARENGEYMDEEYLAGQIRAFQSLKDHQLSN